MKRLLIIQVAALSSDLLRRNQDLLPAELTFRPMQGVFPAVTCTAQGSFRTASPPAQHGMIANGLYLRDLHRPMFWEQSADLVRGQRIWEGFRRRGGRVGVLFWQQSLGEAADVILSPAPIHRHHGGMIQDCYSEPAGLYARLCRAVGRPFRLAHYWGPRASARAGDWIAAATAALLDDPEVAPDLCLTYLPGLDYDLQRWGTTHPKARRALGATLRQMGLLLAAGRRRGYEVLIFGDYAVADTPAGAVFPNRALKEAGLMKVREIRDMEYPDFHSSPAFAVVDHQIAHVYTRNAADAEAARRVLAELPGVAEVLDRAAQAQLDLNHPNSGELVIVAQEGKWLAYPWWTDNRRKPDYASHVDIHNKPGYDPCELLLGWPPMSVSQNTGRIRGSHGRIGPGREVAWAATMELPGQVLTLIDLAGNVRDWLNGADGSEASRRGTIL